MSTETANQEASKLKSNETKVSEEKYDVSYTKIEKLKEIHFETQSDFWLSQASHVKFKVLYEKKSCYCRLMHGKSNLGGSLLRVVEWDNESQVLISFDQSDLIGAKLISIEDANALSSPLTSTKALKQKLNERFKFFNNVYTEVSSSKGNILEDFPTNHSKAGSFLKIYSYPKQNSEGSKICEQRYENHCSLQLAEDSIHAKSCQRSISTLANPTKISRCLVILGPHIERDKRKAKYVYKSVVRKMFFEANIEYDLFQTIYEGHAYDRIKEGSRKNSKGTPTVLGNDECEQVDAKHYDAIIIIGGDSIVTQVQSSDDTL